MLFKKIRKKNKIKIPKGMTNQQKCDVDWIIKVLTNSYNSAISSVNIFFKDFHIEYGYNIKIKIKGDLNEF